MQRSVVCLLHSLSLLFIAGIEFYVHYIFQVAYSIQIMSFLFNGEMMLFFYTELCVSCEF